MNKPVWRVNTGQGVPSDLGDEVFVNDIGILRANDLKSEIHFSIHEGDLNITIYQTNHTKAAKYERVECEKCSGRGILAAPILPNPSGAVFYKAKCQHCNVKGYKLERIK